MFDMPTSIAFSTAVFSVCSTVVVALIKFVPPRNGNGEQKMESRLSVAESELRGIDRWMQKVERRLDEIVNLITHPPKTNG